MKWFEKILTSRSGLSSKRFITLAAFLLLAIGFLTNLFFDFTVEEFMFNTISYVVFAGLGFTASEMFAGVNNNKIKKEDEENGN